MNRDLTNFNKFRYNEKIFSTNKYTNQKGKFVTEESFEINLYDTRIKSIEFCWINGMWEITNISYFQYQTDPKQPKMAGLLPLATESEVTKDVMDNDDSAITPSLLEKRHSTETRKGLIRIAKMDEVITGTDDSTSLTPLKLASLKSTSDLAGIIKLATQEDVDEAIDNTKAVTPLTLDKKLPNEDGKKGVVSLVNTNETLASDKRGSAGKGIYNFNDNVKVITPKSLDLLIANEGSKGLSYKATLDEVLNGTINNNDPIFVHPFELNKRIASEEKTGFSKIALLRDVIDENTDNDSDYITPKKLYSVLSSDEKLGLIRISKTEDIANKDNSTALTPLGLSNVLSKENVISNSSNITITGNLWDTIHLDFNTIFNDTIKFVNVEEESIGYHFKFISTEEDIKKYNLPMVNFTDVEFDGEYIYSTDEEPIFGEYLYESFKSSTKHVEKIYCDNKEWVRETVNGKTKGWVINYSIDNKPTTDDINAVNKDELIVGKIQVKDYLDIIVDNNNRLRIYPDNANQKVSFSWLEDYNEE